MRCSEFGERIFTLRTSQGLTQPQCASLRLAHSSIGAKATTWWHDREKGKTRKWDADEIRAIAEALSWRDGQPDEEKATALFREFCLLLGFGATEG